MAWPVSKEIRNSNWLLEVPKVELHIHLEGATSPETFLELSKKNNIALPFNTVEEGRKQFQYVGFMQFLDMFKACVQAIRDENDFYILIDRFAADQARQNIRYAEFFISMSLHIMHGLDPSRVLSVIGHACRKAEADYGIKLRCIPDISRDRELGIALDVLKSLIRNKSEYIIGLGLGGSERNDTKSFAGLFITAKQVGLRTVVHAGEWKGTQVIWDAINSLGAERIGHGITIVKDPTLIEFLKATQIPIEVSPTSNRCTGIIPQDQPHPIHEMVRLGLNVTVNSDDPTFFGVSLTDEFVKLHDEGMSDSDLVRLLHNAVNSSFMSMADKKTQLDELRKYLTKNGKL